MTDIILPAEHARRSALCLLKLSEAAIMDSRCPSNPELVEAGIPAATSVIGKLARQGEISVEVYGRNYRVIEIHEGPAKGQRTAECPWGGKPYKVITATTQDQ